ncbi:1,4-dihydroxy-2-naphthoate polyprenyltransferase [Leifsonia bigeumensis]|uniref:1,4-dihydroxy-2-naphthoate octaprenyltransferase n=1 Tax=Leifsonella bigeumensis TaxID=433643 RepID=A0ABP7FC67_9MICO
MARNSNPKQQRLDPAKTPVKGAVREPVKQSSKVKIAETPTYEKKKPVTVKKRKGGRPGGRSPVPVVHPATFGDWVAGARIRTLPLAIAPVALGTAAAYAASGFLDWHWVRALLCLAVALGLQIGVNYANDYSDGVRGADTHRVGPSRLTGSGAAKPRTVLAVALVFFVLAAAAGVTVVVLSGQYWMLAVGAACILAAWFYTGGKHPYGYYGLGEVFVFLFFGLVATAGTTFVQVGTVNLESWVAGTCAGLLACAVLVANNLRDIDQDRVAGKRTLTVLFGSLVSRILFTVFAILPFVGLAFFVLLYENAYLVYFCLLLAVPAAIIVLTAKTPKEFLLALKLTSLTALFFGVGLALAIAF